MLLSLLYFMGSLRRNILRERLRRLAKRPQNVEEYRSGHNEAVLKTVWGKPHGGSNPSSSATKSHNPFG